MMRAVLLGALVALNWVGTTKAAVIDFDTLPGNNGDSFISYVESGFTVSAASGNPKVATLSGNPEPGIFFDLRTLPSSSINVSYGGQEFIFTSVDLRSGASSPTASINYSISGFLGSMQVFTQTGFAFGGPPNSSFSTVASIQPGTLIDTLTINESVGSGSFTGNLDNIVVQAAATVPEPASLVLLGMGIAGMVAARRRRAD